MVSSIQQSSLVKPGKSEAFEFKPRTVVVIGNGAVASSKGDGWEPVKRVLSKPFFVEMDDEKFKHYSRLDPEFILAHAGFFSRLSLLAMLRDKQALEPAAYSQYVRSLEPSLIQIERFRIKLGEAYHEAVLSKELTLRPFPEEIQLALAQEDTGVITTNWDELLWNDPRCKNLVQLHGRSGAPRTLILPTESMVDHDNFRDLHRSTKPTTNDEIAMAAYERSGRGESEARELFLAYAYSRNWLRGAENLIIYGLAGNLYDVELHSLFLGANEAPKRCIRILNPKSDHVKRWTGILGIDHSGHSN